MATKTLVPVEEYLRMSFDGPDCEYLDGEIVDRNVGEDPHSSAQKNLIKAFLALEEKFGFRIRPEIRVKISPARYRVVDVAVFREKPAENVPSSPPYLAVEIVSRDDKYLHILEKFEDYRRWGVPNIWLVDPWSRKFSVFDATGLREVPAFQLPEFDCEISPGQVFE
jgi:Uma2 family endonuclease